MLDLDHIVKQTITINSSNNWLLVYLKNKIGNNLFWNLHRSIWWKMITWLLFSSDLHFLKLNFGTMVAWWLMSTLTDAAVIYFYDFLRRKGAARKGVGHSSTQCCDLVYLKVTFLCGCHRIITYSGIYVLSQHSTPALTLVIRSLSWHKSCCKSDPVSWPRGELVIQSPAFWETLTAVHELYSSNEDPIVWTIVCIWELSWMYACMCGLLVCHWPCCQGSRLGQSRDF